MLTATQIQERSEAITARLQYVVAAAADQNAHAVYTLPSTGKLIDFSRQKHGWKLSRLLYRVGELRINGAAAALAATEPLLTTEQDAHAFVRSLGVTGSVDHLPVLERVGKRFATSDLVQRTLRQSWLQLQGRLSEGDPKLFDQLRATHTEVDFTGLLQSRTVDEVRNEWLYPTYLYVQGERKEWLPLLRGHLLTLPARGNYFQPVRYILKAAEQLADYDTLATLHHWMWAATPESRVLRRYKWDRKEDGGWFSTLLGTSAFHPEQPYDWRNPTSTAEESEKLSTKWGFTVTTRRYLLRRLFRHLDRLGLEANAPAYTTWAAELLLQLNGRTVRPAFEEQLGRYNYDPNTRRYKYTSYKLYYPVGADLTPLHWVISSGEGGMNVRPDAVLLGSSEPLTSLAGRRERYAILWDKAPVATIRLLVHSAQPIVQEFALRVYADNPGFAEHVAANDVLGMLHSSHREINALALKLVQQRPELLTSGVAYALIVHQDETLQAWAYKNVAAEFNPIFSSAMRETDNESLTRAVVWLYDRYKSRLMEATDEELDALTLHPLERAGLLAATILGNYDRIPYRFILRLMTSRHPSVRTAGIELFGRLPVEELYRDHLMTVTGMCVAEEEEVRAAAAPVARRVAGAYPDFAHDFAEQLIELLLSRGKATEIHGSIADLLNETPFQEELGNVNSELVWKLVRSRKAPAQRVGLAALEARHQPGALTTAQLVELGRHDFVDLRQFAYREFTANRERTVYEVLPFLQIFNSHFEDSRQFAESFLRTSMQDRDWTPAVLIALLDVPREEVQTFAIEFIKKYVGPEDATDFLLRASQHPGYRVQEFAAGWLHQYASGKPVVIEELKFFFQTLLGQISRGRVAKDRVFDFLETESENSEPVARFVLPLLRRLMLTIAVGDRARCWEILNRLRRKYPHLDTPLSTVALPAPNTANR